MKNLKVISKVLGGIFHGKPAPWRVTLSDVLLGAAAVGTGALVLQRLALGAHLSERPKQLSGVGSRRQLPISILKPLCGLDDGLAENLQVFASLPYSQYELLLGVRDREDPAFPLAMDVAKRHKGRVRVVLQRGEPGLNPKVNQLISLGAAARFDLLLISDSNVRPPQGYLEEVSAMFEDPRVGCTTNPVAGFGHKTMGATFDNLQAAISGSMQVAGSRVLEHPFVVGKSQGLRRSVLDALGGFQAYKDVLAEDYIIGRDVQRAGYRVAVGRLPVYSYAEKRSVPAFFERYSRWTTMQATAHESPLPAAGMMLLNPIPLAAAAALAAPSPLRWGALAGVVLAKVAVDMSTAHALGVSPLGFAEAALIPAKDIVLAGAQLHGMVKRTVSWRGNQLRVGPGTQLERLGELQAHTLAGAPQLSAAQPQPIVAQDYAPAPARRQPAARPAAAPAAAPPVAAPAPRPDVQPAPRQPAAPASGGPRFRPPRRSGQRARRRSRLVGSAPRRDRA